MAAGPLPAGEETEGTVRRGADPGLIAQLSLLLLLLAFFILMTALSRFEQDRVHRVVESVTDAFGVRVALPLQQPVSAGGLGFYDAMKPVAEQLRRVVAATLPVKIEIEVRRDGELRIEIPYDVLFGIADASPRATVRPLLVALTRALNGQRFESQPWMLDASARLADFGGRTPAIERDLAVRRAGAVVRSLAALGLPSGRLAAGLLDDAAPSLRLTVRPPAIGPAP
ncbi:Flagellar motor protein MotB [Tistlia consotensis]|uniref:Flagellar motor protein MotB n=1 Tax=Tistlia consotensis USBA 355 TaxID=560819 RepID=A0A1Y6CPU2_9PROT|nr:hypothetical protein [Tistlia consotensis]SMF68041.1 Flagellar motor protein MotB [Tistlia consotensis USBA 355]SNR99127.1 Flagellar motor protein MotB [Tistlia consotensis]